MPDRLVVVVAAVVTAAMAVTGCGSGSGHSAGAAASVAGGLHVQQGGLGGNDGSFLESSASDVAFVRWTESAGSLVGTFDYEQADAQSSTGTATTETSLTGLHHDDKISITLSEGLGSYKTFTGSLSGSALSLTFPQPDGQLADSTFHNATVNDYNAAVAKLASQALGQASRDAMAASQAGQQDAQRRLDAALAAADTTFVRDLANIADGVHTLQGKDLTFKDALAEGASALAQARADYATEQQDASRPTPDCGTVSSDSGTVQSDEGSVESGQGSVESSTGGVTNDVEVLNSSSATARQDLTALQQAQAADPSGGAQHGPSDLAVAVRVAEAEVSTAVKAVRQATATAQGYVDSAKQVVAAADAVSNRCQ